MANLHDIERRISSVKSTRQITSTMQMIAATKVAKSANRLEESRPYANSISTILSRVADNDNGINHPLLKTHQDNKVTLLIVVVSDKGLAGGFNSNILRAANQIINSNKKENKVSKVIACGKKAHSFFDFRGIGIEKQYIGSSDNPTFEQAEEIANFCIDEYKAGNVDEVLLIYNKCKNSMEQTVEQIKVLPCDSKMMIQLNDNSSAEDKDNEFEKEILYEPNTYDVLQGLIPTYIRTVIFNALLDSAAGEQVARRVAMQAATDNADEMVDSLTRLYNSVRQGAITTELNEIVGGADALSSD